MPIEGSLLYFCFRRYLAYNLTPVAGVAAHIARNGVSTNIHPSSCILSPLPLSGFLSMPVTTLGHFIVRHSGGRYIFGSTHDTSLPELKLDGDRLVEAWNKELMLCVRDSYVEMVLEFQKLKKDPLSSTIELRSAESMGAILQTYGDRVLLVLAKIEAVFWAWFCCNQFGFT